MHTHKGTLMKIIISLFTLLLTSEVFSNSSNNFNISAQVSRCEATGLPGSSGAIRNISSFLYGKNFVIHPSDFTDNILEKTFDDESSGSLYFKMALNSLEEKNMSIDIFVEYTSADKREKEWGSLYIQYGHNAIVNSSYRSCSEKSDEGTLNIIIRTNNAN